MLHAITEFLISAFEVWAVVIALLLMALCLFLLIAGMTQNALKARDCTWQAWAWLTTRKQRDNAKAWTVGQFKTLRRTLAKENPELLEEIRKAMNE